MRLEDIQRQVAAEVGVPVCAVHEAYSLFWRNIKEHLSSMRIKDTDYSEEEFGEIQNCCNLPYFGKVGISWSKYQRQRRQREFFKKLRDDKTEENQTDVHRDSHNL